MGWGLCVCVCVCVAFLFFFCFCFVAVGGFSAGEVCGPEMQHVLLRRHGTGITCQLMAALSRDKRQMSANRSKQILYFFRRFARHMFFRAPAPQTSSTLLHYKQLVKARETSCILNALLECCSPGRAMLLQHGSREWLNATRFFDYSPMYAKL